MASLDKVGGEWWRGGGNYHSGVDSEKCMDVVPIQYIALRSEEVGA